MEVIDFDNDNKNKVKNHKLFPIIIGLVMIVVITQSIRYYNNWTKNIELLEKAIEYKEINVDSLYTILESKLVKIENINKYVKDVKNISFSHELKKIGENFSPYAYPFYNKNWSDEQLDSIKTTLTAIEVLETRYKDIIEPENELLANVYKLKGLEKLIFDKVDSKNYVLNLKGSTEENNLGVNTEVFPFEQEVRNILKQQDSLRNLIFLQKNINPEEYQLKANDFWYDAVTQSFYFEFLFNPSKENLENLISRVKINDTDFPQVFRTVLWRVMNEWKPAIAKIETVNARLVDLYALSILREYAVDCRDCAFNEYLFLYYFNTGNVQQNILTKSMSDLKFEESDIRSAFFNSLQFDESRDEYWDEYLHILYRYSLFLDSKDQNELLKFRNSLKRRLEKFGFTDERIGTLEEDYRASLAAIYFFDLRIRFNKNDHQEAINDFKEIDYLLDATGDESDSDVFANELLFLIRRSTLLATWWYSEGNVNGNFKSSCYLLKRASELNPEEYYDMYITECL